MYKIILLMCFAGLSRASEVVHVVLKPAHKVTTNFGLKMPVEQSRILNDVSWGLRLVLLKDYSSRPKQNGNDKGARPVDVQALVLPAVRRESEAKTSEEAENEDKNMKMKLIRLMYETLRDSDLKVKRAELIRKHYSNSSDFQMGYLIGDVTDKFNIMSDISLTLKRVYHEWKPIEHVNAYEQIANLGVDVGHIIDMIKGVERRARGQHQRTSEDVDITKKKTYVQYYVEKQLQVMSGTVSKECAPATTEKKLTKQNMTKIKHDVTTVRQIMAKTKPNVAKGAKSKQNTAKALAKTNYNVLKAKLALAKAKKNLAKVKQIKSKQKVPHKVYYVYPEPTPPPDYKGYWGV